MKATAGFNIFMGKGFAMTFENGHTVSVQFGPGNYCDKSSIHNYDEPAKVAAAHGSWESTTAEVASWGPDGAWTTKQFFQGHNDDVRGWLKADEVAAFITWVQSQAKAEKGD